MLSPPPSAELDGTPPLLRLHRRPGAASARPYADARSPVNVVGMAAIAGPYETWLIELHDSFASIEDVDKSIHLLVPSVAMDDPGQPSGDILAGSGSLIAVYRPGFSYLPEQAIQIRRKARYCQVSIYQVHPGSEPEFANSSNRHKPKHRNPGFRSCGIDT